MNLPATHTIPVPGGRVSVTDHGGPGEPMILLHGFPDDSRIYDRLVPHLEDQRVITLDFLGYGRSDRIAGGPLPAGQRVAEVSAVVEALDLRDVTVIGHDASGPVAMDYGLANQASTRRIVLMNCYYGRTPHFRVPEMIRLLADPALTPLADAIIADPRQRGWLLEHTGRQFGTDGGPDSVRSLSILPQFFGDDQQPDALPAIRQWTADLFPDLDRQDARIAAGQLAELKVPVRFIFGGRDPYLSPHMAREIADLVGSDDVQIVDDASHWPQWDQPSQAAELLSR
jgi:pimeloyl-ACP methyl ester carboxylesterase